MLINFVGPQNPGDASQQSFLTYEFEAVAKGEDPFKPFRNKIVLIIPAATELKDTFNTPFGLMYGGATQANALNTILNRYPIMPVGSTGNSLLVLIMGLITTIVASRFGIWRSAAGVLILFVGYGLLVVFLFDQMRIWINLVTPETAVVLSFAAIMALRFATEERQRRKIRKSFGQYVTPEIIDTLVAEPEALKPRRRPISTLFVDIRGFTSMSEGMEPENVVSALDIYLEQLTESVQCYGGTINKYVGDELVAIWNAPLDQPDHALRAVHSALDMVSRLEGINEQLRLRELPAIKYGIGVNSGDAVVGRMGSSFREQYDVIGDTVNTGARLCSAAAGGEIIIGEATWQAVGNQLIVEETERLRLKGKSAEIRTFRVLGLQAVEQMSPLPAPAPA
jgi:adenylate cyclase